MLFGRPSSGAGGSGSQSPGGEPRTVGVLRSKLSGSRSSPAAARMRWASLGAATAVAVGLGVGKLISKLFRCRGAPDAADMPPAVADVERGASDLAVQVAESAPVRAEGATEAAESPLPQSVGVTVAISSRDAVPEHAPLSEMGAVVSEDQEQAGAPVGSASRHSYNHRRNMRSDSEGHLSPTRTADSYPEGVQPGRGYTRATLSTIGWGRLARQHQGPPFRRGWRHQQEQDELNRLLDLALDSPLQLLVEFQRQSPIVERLMRLQNAPVSHSPFQTCRVIGWTIHIPVCDFRNIDNVSFPALEEKDMPLCTCDCIMYPCLLGVQRLLIQFYVTLSTGCHGFLMPVFAHLPRRRTWSTCLGS